jgi:hypothetical protein
MNTKNLLLASLVGALVTTALAHIPVINLVNCLLCIGYWGGAILAVLIYKNMTGSMTFGQAMWIGILTGLFSGFLGLLLSLIGLAGVAGLASRFSQFMPNGVPRDFNPTGFGMRIVFGLIGLVVNVVFGLIGGLIGGAIFQTKAPASQ